MIVEKVRIQNFRSIVDSGDVKIDEKITILVGKNDQGKTNFLKALESFNRDYLYKNSDWCYYVKRKDPKKAEVVKIWFKLDDSDRKKLKEIDKRFENIEHLVITKYFDNHYEIYAGPPIDLSKGAIINEVLNRIKDRIEALSSKMEQHAIRYKPFASSKPQYDQIVKIFLSVIFKAKNVNEIHQAFLNLYNGLRNLPNRDQQINADIEIAINDLESLKNELTSAIQKDIKSQILNLLPTFIYFSSIDILPDAINIDEYLRNKDKYKTFTNLFRLANLNVEDLKTKDVFERRFATDEASAIITGYINTFWKQERVEIVIGCELPHIFVYIRDDTGARDPPSRRSEGFQWFLSFYINFMAGTKGDLKNAVLLLDNPGWVLHPSGQKDLLNTLEKIAENNQIILTTHSPFLIDKNKLERIRIIEKKPNGVGTKVYEKFYDSIYDSLQVIRAAIGADISDSLFGHKNNIVVEGYSDKIYLESMAEYLKRKGKETINLSKVMINGAGGADKIPFLLSWYKAEKYISIAIIDNDNEGRKVLSEIKRMDIDIDTENDILKLDEIDDAFRGKDIEIEDLFDEEFFNKAVNEAYKEIFKEKLGKDEISLDELPGDGLITKRYAKFFKDKKLGGFDKIKVALTIKRMLEKDEVEEGELGKTISNFERLFGKIKERFKERGVEL